MWNQSCEDTSEIPLSIEDEDRNEVLDFKKFIRKDAHMGGGTGVEHTNYGEMQFLVMFTEILKEQRVDGCCQTALEHTVTRDALFFEAEVGMLCLKNPRENNLIQVCVASTLRARVLPLDHHSPLFGHAGPTRLNNRILKRVKLTRNTCINHRNGA